MTARSRKVRITIERRGPACVLPLPFDPCEAFGKARAPVVVTLNGYSYRTTITVIGDGPCIPLSRGHREAASLSGDETLLVTITLDEETRAVEAPRDLLEALSGAPLVWKRWCALSESCRREHIEAIVGTKKPETRARRIAETVRMVAERTRSIRSDLPRGGAPSYAGVRKRS